MHAETAIAQIVGHLRKFTTQGGITLRVLCADNAAACAVEPAQHKVFNIQKPQVLSNWLLKKIQMKNSLNTDPKAYLIPYPVESFSKPILIESENTYIGRDPKDNIQIAYKKISRNHALVTLESGRYFLKDLGSRNGTYLNNERIQEAPLISRDKITIGNRTFLFLLQPGTVGELLMDPSIAATETIAISHEEIDFSELWAQNAEHAKREFIWQGASESPDTIQSDSLARTRLSLLYQLSENLCTTNNIESIYNQGLELIIDAIAAADCALVVLKSASDQSFNIVAAALSR